MGKPDQENDMATAAGKVVVSTEIPAEFRDMLDARAKDANVSRSVLVARALVAYIRPDIDATAEIDAWRRPKGGNRYHRKRQKV